jgi:phosphate starvation-inducible PhoH-like protein
MSERNTAADADGLSEVRISLAGVDQLALLGGHDAHLRRLEAQLDGTVTVRGDTMVLRGPRDQVTRLQEVVADLVARLERGQPLDEVTLDYLLARPARPDREERAADADEAIYFSAGTRRSVRTKTAGQQRYVEAIRDHDVVFAIGPAGTGKTYLAVVMALDYLKRRLVDRIILVRPAVEAGEQLGYLPGDLQEKINPYLRPLQDALSDLIGPGRISRYMSSGVIEASPLAYMRGRTLNNSFVILDEAQNTTVGQMKMFLTRLGFQSKVVVTGDVTQVDLRNNEKSGLVHVREILSGTEGVAFVVLDTRDVVRHPLVSRIVDAFQEAEQQGNGRS